MPTYQYRCADCGEQLEVVQKFSDDPLQVCPACQGSLRKVFSPVGIVFKGSGFYRTDSRKGSSGDGAKKDKEAAGAKSGDSGPAKSTANGSSGSDSSSGSSGSSGGSGSAGPGSAGPAGKSGDKSSSSSAAAASSAG